MHLVKRPTALFHPWIALRALDVAVSWLERCPAAPCCAEPRHAFRSPIPTQVVSNGEYMPTAAERRRSAGSRRVLAELADRHGKRLCTWTAVSSCKTSCGMAAAFVAMNQVYGDLLSVGVAEAAEPEAAAARARPPCARSSVIDVQLHFLRDDFAWDGILVLGEWAKRWNPVLAHERRHPAALQVRELREGGVPRQRHRRRI